METPNFKSRGPCDSLLGEGKGGVSASDSLCDPPASRLISTHTYRAFLKVHAFTPPYTSLGEGIAHWPRLQNDQ